MSITLQILSSFFLLTPILVTGNYGRGVEGSSHHHHHHHHRHEHENYGFQGTKLFVFGDSYADTGNIKKNEGNSWNIPYGITFPGKPAGRFSNGRVLTDYLAQFLGLKSPIPYKLRKYAGKKRLSYGMNFAFGGTGVFDTLFLGPNMTTQVDFFQNLIHYSVYTKRDLQSSVALVSLAGNDYNAYIARGGTAQGMKSFITSVVNQLALNLKRIQGLGVRKIAVTALEPLGCLPRSSVLNSFQQCNGTENLAATFHNLIMQQTLAKLNNESKDSSIVILDLYSSFTTVLKNRGNHPGSLKFETPLKPCCMGISNQYSCGNVDDKGRKLYTICDNPESVFFWDTVHLTQAGWHAIYIALKETLKQVESS